MNKWSNLPNAKHIDWVIQSVKDNPREWNRAWDLVRDRSWIAARDRAYDAARGAVRGAAWDAVRGAVHYAVWTSVLALVAYDDSVKYLSMTYEELKVWATISEEPASILLLPMVKAKELISKKTTETVT